MAGVNINSETFKDELINHIYKANTEMMIQIGEMRRDIAQLKKELLRCKYENELLQDDIEVLYQLADESRQQVRKNMDMAEYIEDTVRELKENTK